MNAETPKKLSTESYKGVRDFFPEDLAIQKYIFSTMRNVVEKFGYQEYSASVLEPTELYAAKTGSEIVNEQTYSFKDRGDRDVTLRPEMTPTVTRMVAAKRRELGFPLRWYSIPNLFRYENPQRGRLREHWQLNVDLFGATDIQADIEVITVAYEIMKAFGAKDEDFEIRLNDRKFTETLYANFFELSQEQSILLRRLVDRRGKIDTDTFTKNVNDIFQNQNKSDLFIRSLDHKGEDYLKWISENALGNASTITIESYKRASEIFHGLKLEGITNIIFDPELQRGFDYYTGPVFEVFDTNPENKRALFGGGRYDDLLSIFGSDKVPAIGFGMGDVTIKDFLEIRGLLPQYKPSAELYICRAPDTDPISINAFAQDLREKGLNVAVDVSDKKLGDQIKTASKQAIPFIVCIGTDELAKQEFKVKNLVSGDETLFKSSGEIVTFIKNKQ